ncbi:hypothetical protein PHLGIDRAFT_498120 [Phlebiopsis gigantea 11061_1 CR5-6]|uniref:F-box domain-containing protein n=1 Tax=Phlebiopsis gigantea (strain 11061_1 CR5-6) TaxID=745531 RepID=A0A0C3S4S6_PHLG1|nr:hypothetical protein PHLGIDRAFT_498120 [Phlebiopsis gigantea 11061_1 CR5-6]
MKLSYTVKAVRFAGPTKSLDALPNDVLVDHVFKYLDVQDILRLRQASRFFDALTRHVVVWKRLLQSTSSLVPPLLRPKNPPAAESSAHDLERIVVSAHALDKAWQNPAAAPRQWHFNAHWSVREMAVVPGGEFLVASVSDGADSGTKENECAVVVYAMDTRSTTVVVPVIWLSTPGVAHDLSARSLCMDKVDGIAVTYVNREWEDVRYTDSGIDLDAYYPSDAAHIPWVKTTCHVVHIALSDLRCARNNANLVGWLPDALKRQMKDASHICTMLGHISSQGSLSAPSIDMFPTSGSQAVVWSVLQYPNKLLCKRLDLHDDYTFVIQFSEPGPPYPPVTPYSANSVRAIKLLPSTNKILVVRHNTHVLNVEWHDIPPELLSDIPPPDTFPKVIPTRSAFRKFYSGPNTFDTVDVVLTADTEDTALGTIHVYAHVSNTPSSPHPGVLHLAFPPQPGHVHHFDDPARPHHTTRTSPLPAPLPMPIQLGAVEWAGPGGVIFVSQKHYCSAGMSKEWIDGIQGVEWRLLRPCTGVEGFGRVLWAKCKARGPAVERRRGRGGRSGVHMQSIERVLGDCRRIDLPLNVPIGEIHSVWWDDTTGRLGWCQEETKVRIIDLVDRSSKYF